MKVSLALASISLVASSLAVPFTREIPDAKSIERRDDNTGDATVDKAGVWAGPWVWKRDENSADATVDKAGVEAVLAHEGDLVAQPGFGYKGID
ncbi:hypothetical protein BDV36DRAFT_297236 [Aspergillus pseudocaelatus]|uniref:Uncharacterized protein n=1 Tax=Aspergillus pseudocaelatus TaxID=1825620 RepID=A0ABQ6WGQ7_9EURO|nr:hypothetical protein BDV36DRAFT_297236 [Aspergillus pseudocaelatus]